MNPRITKACQLLKAKGIDALFVSSPANISYLTETISRDSYLLISAQKHIYFTDARYTREARDTLDSCFKVEKISRGSFAFLNAAAGRLGLKKVGFEGKFLPFLAYQKLKKELKKARLIPTQGLIEGLRQTKDEGELKRISAAIGITIAAFKYIRRFLRPGKTELEVAAELERFIRLHGAQGSAFEIIVASGPNSSYPHHLTSRRRLKKGEPVLIDLGVDYSGYKSDLTRTYFLGKMKFLYRRVYEVVRRAQELAINKAREGVRLGEIDAAARGHIAREGFSRYFSHSTGHGVGLEVHEAPTLAAKENGCLGRGMVFTVEPGIYLPRKFGVRIEDMVFLTGKGVQIPSGSFNK